MSDASTSRARHHLLVGDAANALALVSTVLFLAAALTKARFLSPAWRSLGFCITNPDSPALSSHAMCFYLDLVGAAGLAVLYGLGRNRVSPAAAARVLVNVPGTLGHGVGHGYLAMAMGRYAAVVSVLCFLRCSVCSVRWDAVVRFLCVSPTHPCPHCPLSTHAHHSPTRLPRPLLGGQKRGWGR